MYHYPSYRGRVPLKRKIAVAVMVLILILSALYLGMSRYTEYGNDGSVSFHFPWQDREEEKEESETPDIDLVINAPVDPMEEMNAVEIAAETLRKRRDEGEWWNEEGYNAVSLRLKEGEGWLQYAFSSAPQELIHSNALSRTELETLLEDEVYTVARLSCFRDSAAAREDMTGKGLCQSNGYVWYDNENGHWLDPGKAEAREYLLALCAELGELGFDEVVLEDVRYPTEGKLQKSAPVETDRIETIRDFLAEVAAVLEKSDTRLGLVVEEETLLLGENETAGLRLRDDLAAVDRLYVRTDDAAAAEQALRAVSEQTRLVILDGAEGARCTVQ